MRFLKRIEDILWPRGLGCLCCDHLCPGELLCPTCRKGLDALKLSDDAQADGNIHSVYRYDGTARQLVILLKDQCLEDAASVLAQEMANVIKTMALPDNTVLTWVPMPEVRKVKRGIDHGHVLCQAVARQTGLPIRQILIRSRNSHTQRGLNREARLTNIAASIRCEKHITDPVILIDDVLTTGATVSVCTKALKDAGAPAVFALTATKVVMSKSR